MAQLIKNLPALWEIWVRSLGWEDPLEKGMATHSSILAMEDPIVHGVAKSQTRLTFTRFVKAFPPGIKRLLISWLQSPSTMILEPRKIKSVTISMFSYPICHEVMGPDACVFWMLNFKPGFSLCSFTLIRNPFSSSSLTAIRVVSAYLKLLIHFPAVLIPAYESSSPVRCMMYSA